MLVTVTSDSASQGVTWALSGPGSLSNITTTTALYTGSTNAGDTATITATGVANPTEIVTASLYMVPLPTIPTATLPTATIGPRTTELSPQPTDPRRSSGAWLREICRQESLFLKPA